MLTAACVSKAKPLDFPFDLTTTSTKAVKTASEQAESLKVVAPQRSSDAELVEDIVHMLDAVSLEDQGNQKAALDSWRRAMAVAKGVFGEKAFVGWLKSYVKTTGKKWDRLTLARQVLAETSNGNASPWFIEKNLTNDLQLAAYIGTIIPDALETANSTAETQIPPPTRSGIPAGDPLLTATARDICRSTSNGSPDWTQWRQTLTKDVNLYFDSLILQCSGQTAKASEQFVDVGNRLAVHDATVHLAIEAYARAIKIRRDAGERDSVAPLFLPLMRFWKNKVLSESSFGVTRQAFDIRRIDDAMAAARHLSLLNEVEVARAFSSEAIDLAMAAQSQQWAQTPEAKALLAGNIAESYHLQAFRLGVEARDYPRALALTTTALQIDHLSTEWLQRLQWSRGLYEYLANNYESARRSWELMLSDNSDETYRPLLLYWIARCHAKIGNLSEAEFYRKTLAQDHPLSFYAVVGLDLDGGTFAGAWTKSFSDPTKLKETLSKWSTTDVDAMRSHPVRGRNLRRAELLVGAKVDLFVSTALDELQRSLDVQSTLDDDLRANVYVTRLYAAANNWLGVVSLTTRLAKTPQFWEKFPEQILIYFPKPWMEFFETAADRTGVSSNMLLAVSRQESTFRPEVKSPANAYGLMQFTPATARRIAQQGGIPLGDLPESLLNPETSVLLGAHYLKLLQERYKDNESSIYAAYNAGEQAADTWLQRREIEDTLAFIELIPYLETRSYVKNVWRNRQVYDYFEGRFDPPTLTTQARH